jgi:AcrR family transcriptional regulator
MPRKPSTEPRKRPQQERSRIAVEAILEATTRILTEEGYEKANTNRIAERAGVSIGSLYQYFPNKESLMTALMVQHSDEIVELVESKLLDFYDAPVEIVIPEIVKAAIGTSDANAESRRTDCRVIAIVSFPLARFTQPAVGRMCECSKPRHDCIYFESYGRVAMSCSSYRTAGICRR